ncbi:MAG TPA: EamA family transporter [Acidobacteriaceae bacterium]|jgi:drug/metabolite transporter (DMT)-like permease
MTGATIAPLGSNVVALGLTAAALWGVSDFLGGIAARRAPAVVVVAVAHGVSLAVLSVIAATVHPDLPDRRIVLWAVITGLTGGIAVILFYRALALGEMGLTAALTGLLTALVPVVVSWFTEGHPSESQLVGFVIAAVAICLIAYQPSEDLRPHPRGLLLGTIAGLGFGAFLVASKYASPQHSNYATVLWPLAYSRLASASVAVIIVLISRWRSQTSARTEQRSINHAQVHGILIVLSLAGAAGLLEAWGNLLYMLSTVSGRLDVAAVLSSLYPAGTILLAIWLLKERATGSKALGMALALLAVLVISL